MKRSVGEQIAAEMEAGHAISGAHVEATAKEIDRAIRREKAKAWDECAASLGRDEEPTPKDARILIKYNPYRGRARR